MKYKIYHGGTQYRFPRTNTKITVYGERVQLPAMSGVSAQIPLLNGDTLYVCLDWTPDNIPWVTFDSESGYVYSIFHCDVKTKNVAQTGFGWLCFKNALATDDIALRVYSFPDCDTAYDFGGGNNQSIAQERFCRKYGECVCVLKVEHEGEYTYLRVLHPNNLKYNGQTLPLPTRQTSLFISGFACLDVGGLNGFYYTIEDGTEGIGFLFDPDGNCIRQSSGGWFSDFDCLDDGYHIHIFLHGYDNIYESGVPITDDTRTFYDSCVEEFGMPISIRYFKNTGWKLEYEGDN